MAEELWQMTGREGSLLCQRWPAFDPAKAAGETATIVVQVNGKVRDKIEFPLAATEDEIKSAALASEKIAEHLAGRTPRKVICVPGRLVNIVV